MIAFLKGTIEDITENSLVLDVMASARGISARTASRYAEGNRSGTEGLYLYAGAGGRSGTVWLPDQG